MKYREYLNAMMEELITNSWPEERLEGDNLTVPDFGLKRTHELITELAILQMHAQRMLIERMLEHGLEQHLTIHSDFDLDEYLNGYK